MSSEEPQEGADALEPQLADPTEILGVHEAILLYGLGGTGKTFTAATAPEPIWFLTPGAKNELKTALSPRFIGKHGRKEVYITSVKEDRERGQMADNPSGYDRCCDAVDAFLEWNDRKGIGVRTIVVDNATILEEYMMNKAVAAEYVLADNKTKSVLARERELGIRKPYDSTYAGAQSFMDRWVAWLRELPFHLVFIAHTYEQSRQKPNSREREVYSISPLFVGAQRTSVPNKFDNVWYATVSGAGRSQRWGIQTERDTIVDAKTRVGGILDPMFEADPNLTEIIEEFAQYGRSLAA